MTLALVDIVRRDGAQTHIHATSLHLQPTGFNVLLGTTLAGKTTLMQIMSGLLPPSSGRIMFNGSDVTKQSVQSRNVAMVFQQFINYPNFSVFENIASPLRVARLGETVIRERVGKVAELLRLSPFLDRRPANLSGGQQQRCALARALVKDSTLVLLDEPLANLDYKLREELRDELPRLFEGRDCTVVYATTEPTEALLLGGYTAALHEGRVTQFGPAGQVYREPQDLLTAQVFSDPPINVTAMLKRGSQIQLGDHIGWTATGRLLSLPDGDYQFGIRPHHVLPVLADSATGSLAIVRAAGVELRGRIRIAEISGSESVIHFDAGALSWVSQSHGVFSFSVGDDVRFQLDVEQALVFDSKGRRV